MGRHESVDGYEEASHLHFYETGEKTSLPEWSFYVCWSCLSKPGVEDRFRRIRLPTDGWIHEVASLEREKTKIDRWIRDLRRRIRAPKQGKVSWYVQEWGHKAYRERTLPKEVVETRSS